MTALRSEAERAAREAVPCSCIDAYRDRDLTDPTCAGCNYDDQIADAIERVAKAFAVKAAEKSAAMAFEKIVIKDDPGTFAPGSVARAAIDAAERGEG